MLAPPSVKEIFQLSRPIQDAVSLRMALIARDRAEKSILSSLQPDPTHTDAFPSHMSRLSAT